MARQSQAAVMSAETSDRPERAAGRRRLLGLSATAGAALAGAMRIGGSGAQAAGAEPELGLAGTWTMGFLPRDAPPGRQPATGLFTFVPGGGVIVQSGPGSRSAAGVVSFATIGLGAWVRTGEREFAANYIVRRFFDDFARIEEFTNTLRLALNEEGDALTGEARRVDRDASGAVIASSETIVRGAPLSIELL